MAGEESVSLVQQPLRYSEEHHASFAVQCIKDLGFFSCGHSAFGHVDWPCGKGQLARHSCLLGMHNLHIHRAGEVNSSLMSKRAVQSPAQRATCRSHRVPDPGTAR